MKLNIDSILCPVRFYLLHEFVQLRGGSLSPFPSRSFRSREPLHRRNGKIRAREVRVLDEAKQQLGVMSLNEALRLAQGRGLDLIEIAATATPPVCRIANYGKFLYEESKRQKESTGSHAGKLKELQISPAIDPHDLSVKVNHAIQFLCDDMKVRVKLRFRGRQKAHKEIGYDLMNKFIKEVALYGQADSSPKMMGDRDLNVLLSPLPRDRRAKNPRARIAEEVTPTAPASKSDKISAG
jgi:translation initiation factor IF-3